MVFEATPYPSSSFTDLKRRTQILASGIEEILPYLPTELDQYYGTARRPCVKWVYLPKDNRYDPEIDADGENSDALHRQVAELFPEFKVAQYQGASSQFFWIWEDGRPSRATMEARLPVMYLLGFAIECHLEGWAFMDDEAWQYGLSKFIKESGFDSETILCGEM